MKANADISTSQLSFESWPCVCPTGAIHFGMGPELVQYPAHRRKRHAELPGRVRQRHRTLYRRCGVPWPGCTAEIQHGPDLESAARLPPGSAISTTGPDPSDPALPSDGCRCRAPRSRRATPTIRAAIPSANVIWNPYGSLSFGAEFMYGWVQQKDGEHANAARIQLSGRYAFETRVCPHRFLGCAQDFLHFTR